MGDPGTGKSFVVRSAFISALDSGLDAKLVLPTAGMAEHVKNLVLQELKGRSINENNIVTFDAWAAASLKPDEVTVTLADLNPLAKAVLNELRPEGFERVIELPGFPKSLCSAVVELIQHGITSTGILKAGPKVPRLTALAKVTDELSKRLAEKKLVVQGTLILRLAELLKNGRKPGPDIVIFDGFYDFTKGQRDCFSSLLNVCNRIIFTLPASLPDLNKQNFINVKKTYDFLKDSGFEFVSRTSSFREFSTGLKGLYSRLFSENPNQSDPKGITFLSGDSSSAILEHVAGWIIRMKKNNRINRWRDVGLIARNLDPYSAAIKRIFNQWGIPVSIHAAEDPKQTGPGPAILGFLEILGQPEPKTGTGHMLKTRNIVFRSFFLTEDAVRKTLIRGFNFKQEESGSLIRRTTPPENLDELIGQATDEKAKEHLEFLQSIANAATIGDIADEIFKSAVSKILKRYSERIFRSGNFDRNGIHDASAVIRAFGDGLSRYLRNRRLMEQGPKTWAEHLASYNEILTTQAIPLAGRPYDAVHAVDVFEARTWDWDHLFILGMVNGEFPGRISEDMFCKDGERAVIDHLLPTARSARSDQELLFAFAASRASKTLTLASHRFDQSGQETSPSLFLDEIQLLFNKPVKQIKASKSMARPVLSASEWVTMPQAAKAAAFSLGRITHFGESSLIDNVKGLALSKNRPTELGLPADTSPWIDFGSSSTGTLPSDSFAILKDRYEPFNVSTLNTFIACPFKSFATRVLRLASPPSPPAPDMRLLGNIAHDVLKVYFADNLRMGQPPKLHALFRKQRNRYLKKMGIKLDELNFDQEQALASLEGALHHLLDKEVETWSGPDGAQPWLFEWEFGSLKKPLMIQHGDRTEPFTGRIDRIDRINDGMLVIDYKLGSAYGSDKYLDDISKGLMPQLPIYCAAARKLHDKPMVGAFIERIRHGDRNGFVDHDSGGDNSAFSDEKGVIKLKSDTFAKLITDAVQGVLKMCDGMRNGDIKVAPREGFARCGLGACDFYDLCRVDL